MEDLAGELGSPLNGAGVQGQQRGDHDDQEHQNQRFSAHPEQHGWTGIGGRQGQPLAVVQPLEIRRCFHHHTPGGRQER